MSEETKAIVASNLTAAFFAAQQYLEPNPAQPKKPTTGTGSYVMTVYEAFLMKLTPPAPDSDGMVEQGDSIW